LKILMECIRLLLFTTIMFYFMKEALINVPPYPVHA
jgi:hypothetical protein